MSLLRILPLSFLFLAPVSLASAQPAQPTEADKMIEAYLHAETDKLSKKFLDGAKTLDEWKQKRTELHPQYLEMLGLWPVPEKTPLKATITNTFDHQGVTIDNLHFQSMPGLYVTANLYRPKGNTKKLPTILYVCGHSNKGRDGSKSAYQGHGMWFASNGYNCLVVDTLQLGEIPGVHHGTYGRPYLHLKAYGITDKEIYGTRWWWLSRGYTPAGVECWNGVRGIDYLLTRDDVDGDKIGVTGISGGGAATFWIAAADDRVKVAVPVSGMSDLESYVKNKIVNGHCDCMFLHNTYRWEWTTIAALIAPRPMLFANSDNDPIFPMDGNRRIMERLNQLYKMYGKPDLVQEYVSEGGHAYRPDLRIAIFKFINKHLKNDPKAPVKDIDFEPIDGKKLRVFPTDADLPKDVLNGKIDEVFVPKAKVMLPEKGKYEAWREELLKELKEKVFREIPKEILNTPPTWWQHMSIGGSGKAALLFMEPELYEKNKPFTTFADKHVGQDRSWAVAFPRFYDIPKLKPTELTLQSIHNWTKKSPPNYVERSCVLLGRTIDELKVYHLLGTLKQGFGRPGEPNTVVGFGEAGILAVYAALLDPKIKELVLVDPPASHMEGPAFLNVLRVLDIPEALGMLAPRKLTLINASDKAFDRVAEIYKLAGAADKLTRK